MSALIVRLADEIRKAIENMNKNLATQEQKAKLIEASRRVRKESMLVTLNLKR